MLVLRARNESAGLDPMGMRIAGTRIGQWERLPPSLSRVQLDNVSEQA